MTEQTTLIAIITGAFVLAGLVKGVIGLGLPTVAMGLLGLAMAPAQAAALLVLPSLVTNLWQMLAGRTLVPLLRRLATMQMGICIGTFAGIGIMTANTGSLAQGILGAVLIAYAAAGLLSVRFTVPRRAEPWLSPLVGMITGAVTGATGLFVVPAVPYINSLGLGKDDLIQALGLSFTVSTLALGAALAHHGAFSAGLDAGTLLALPACVGGMLAGQWLRDRLRPEIFRRWFFCGLLLVGLIMLARALRQA